MPMIPFYTRFHDLAFQEMRVARISDGFDIPQGEYGFLELYCDELDGDCRRVVIQVVGRETGWKIWATINYGWEPPEYYATWKGNKEAATGMWGAGLDPLNPQTRYSYSFLDLFQFIIEDQLYADRLKHHYQMVKDALRREAGARAVRLRKPKGPPRR